MPALPPYVPTKDALLDAWGQNFGALISADPSRYGLVAADVAAISAAVDGFDTAYTVCTSRSTKTPAAVQAKNDAKVVMLAVVRPYAQQISLNAGVASGDKIALGINPRTSTPSPITPPATNPVLVVQSLGHLSVILRYRDSAASVSVKSKPYGAVSCEIYGLVSSTAVTDPTLMFWIASATKSPFQIVRSSADQGKQLYLCARWKTRTGGFSPFGPILNATVPIVA